MYHAERAWAACSPRAIDYAYAARDRRFAICAGAGLSMSEPSSLPSSSDVAKHAQSSLRSLGPFAGLEDCPPGQLECLGDVMEIIEGGPELLEQVLLESAPWTQALPNFGHEGIAFLVVEGLLQLVLTNWDDCVERATSVAPRIQAVVREADLADVRGPVVMKVHGCATRRGSLLISTEQLKDPPQWAFHLLGGLIGTATIVFLGIGSIPDYVGVRISQLLKEIPADRRAQNVFVVSRSISDRWKVLLPEVGGDHLVAQSSQPFVDELLRSLLHLAFLPAQARLEELKHVRWGDSSGDDLLTGILRLKDALGDADALQVLTWFRNGFFNWGEGQPTLLSPSGERLIVSLSMLASRQIPKMRGPALLDFNGVMYQFIVTQNMLAYQVEREAMRRAERQSFNGEIKLGQTLVVLSVGHIGHLEVPRDIVAEAEPTSILEGASSVRMSLMSAEAMLDEIPRGSV